MAVQLRRVLENVQFARAGHFRLSHLSRLHCDLRKDHNRRLGLQSCGGGCGGYARSDSLLESVLEP